MSGSVAVRLGAFAADLNLANIPFDVADRAQDRAQLARARATLADGAVRTAEADRRDRQIPTIDKMARKALTRKAWPAGAADAVGEVLTGDVRGPVRDLSRRLRG